MTVQPDRLTAASATEGRLGNVRLAAFRFGRTFSLGVLSAAWRRSLRLWPIWTAGLGLIVVAALTVDEASVGWVRGLPGPVKDFFQWITPYGKSDWILVPAGAVCLMLLFADWRAAGRRIAAAWTEIGILVGFAFVAVAGSGILTNIIKQLVGRWRPVAFDRGGAFSFSPFQFDYAYASFPSGHATTMGALAVVIALIAPRHRTAALALCGLVAASRVFVESHFPSDVVGGFLVGAAFTWFYAQAMAAARIGFAPGPAGTIRARAVAVRGAVARPHALRIAVAGLWSAIVGRGFRADSSA